VIVEIYTVLDVLISLVAIFTGFVVVLGMVSDKRFDRWTKWFLITAVATTGFARTNRSSGKESVLFDETFRRLRHVYKEKGLTDEQRCNLEEVRNRKYTQSSDRDRRLTRHWSESGGAFFESLLQCGSELPEHYQVGSI
jgi:hypothetical protein